MKRFVLLFSLLYVSHLVDAQSLSNAVLDAPRTYKKVSDRPVCLRTGEVNEIEKLTKKVFAKIMQSNERARKKLARELARKYKLGDRIIVRGDSGRDVRSVANALVKKLYINVEDVIPTFDNGALLDGELYDALLRFQKDKKLPVDGRVTKDVVKELRKRK